MDEQEWKELKRKEKILKQACKLINVQESHLPRTLTRFLEDIKRLEKELKIVSSKK
jgi:alanyl-tRNA synthetase